MKLWFILTQPQLLFLIHLLYLVEALVVAILLQLMRGILLAVTPPNTSPTLPNNGGAPYVPLSQSEKDKITNELKLDESGFEKMLGEIYFSPEIRKSPHIIGEVKLLYATSYTFRKFLMQYARGYYTLRFVVGDLGDGVFARTKPNDRAMTTEIILNRRYIVNGEFCPTPTMDNIGIIYNTDDPTYCTKALASILVHEALHAQHFTILYDSIMRGIDSTQFYNYLISEGFPSEFADAFVRVYPNGLTKEEAENEFGNAMHEFMKKYCRTQIMRAAKDAMKIFKIVKWELR